MPEFRADHPLLFFIRDNVTQSILFLGRVSEPEASTVDAAGSPGILGDLNGDGTVGSADLDIVRVNWGTTAAASVPEPAAGVGLSALGLLALASKR